MCGADPGRACERHSCRRHSPSSRSPGKLDLFAEDFCAIGRRENGLADIKADFAPVDIESGNDFDISRPVSADLPVHQSDAGAIAGRAVIKIYSLDERTGTVPNPDDGDSYFSHA